MTTAAIPAAVSRAMAHYAPVTDPSRISSLQFFARLNWIDGSPLLPTIEPYRRRIFERALDSFDETGRPEYNQVLCGRAKKNWKSADLVLAALFKLVANDVMGGNQCYILANDEGQAGDDLTLAKKLIEANSVLAKRLVIKQKTIERSDGRGFLMVLPAQDAAGAHGKTFVFVGFDEIHAYKTYAILEALQPDPSRRDALTWITSYASIYHRPGIPLFDYYTRGRAGLDPRLLFSWYAADYTTDPDFANAEPEAKANPSPTMGGDPVYLEEQRLREPAHMFRRLHLNLPGLPAGSAFAYESIIAAIDEHVKVRLPEPGRVYYAFVDMSGGSGDDATLAIAYKEGGSAIVARVDNQGQPPPFNPRRAVERFARICREYGVTSVTGDHYAGETFRADFQEHGIAYEVAAKTKHELYETLGVEMNAQRVRMLDCTKATQELIGLIWRGNKIEHPNREHDDWANAVAGVVAKVMSRSGALQIFACSWA